MAQSLSVAGGRRTCVALSIALDAHQVPIVVAGRLHRKIDAEAADPDAGTDLEAEFGDRFSDLLLECRRPFRRFFVDYIGAAELAVGLCIRDVVTQHACAGARRFRELKIMRSNG